MKITLENVERSATRMAGGRGIQTFYLTILGVWSLTIIFMYGAHFSHETQWVRSMALVKAREVYNRDQAIRLWGANHGGVYVPYGDGSAPSPKTGAFPRDGGARAPANPKLKLVNPDYLVRQLYENYPGYFGEEGRIIRRNPVRPDETPDAWEKDSMQKLVNDESEMFEYSASSNETRSARYMKYIKPHRACFQCHEDEDLASIEGWLSVKIPTADLEEKRRKELHASAVFLGVLWLVGAAGLTVGRRQLLKQAVANDRTLSALTRAQSAARLAAWEWDLTDDTVKWSDEAYRQFGLPPQSMEMTVERFLTFIHPGDLPLIQRKKEEALAEGAVEFEFRIVLEDGSERILHDTVETFYDPSGRAVRLAGASLDVTEARLAETEKEVLHQISRLFLTEEREETIYGKSAEIIASNLRFPMVGIQMYDEARRELVFVGSHGTPLGDDDAPLRAPADSTCSGKVIDSGNLMVFNSEDELDQVTFQPLRKLGARTFIGAPMKSGRKTIGVLGVADVRNRKADPRLTEIIQAIANYFSQALGRKKAQDNLRKSNELHGVLNALLKISLDDARLPLEKQMAKALDVIGRSSFLNSEFKGCVFIVDDGALRLTASHGFEGDPPFRFVDIPFDLVWMKEEQSLETPPPTWGDGGAVDPAPADRPEHRPHAIPIKAEGKILGVLGVCLSDENSRREDEERCLTVAANALAEMIERNRAEEENIRLATAIEQSAESIVIANSEGKAVYVNSAFEKTTGYVKSEAVGRELKFILFDGAQGETLFAEVWGATSRGKVWTGFIEGKKKDGGTLHQEAVVAPIRDKSGAVVNYAVSGRDVSRELALKAQLNQSSKMEAIGTLAGGVAHDFNNLLTAILGYSALVEGQLNPGDPLLADVREVRKAGERAAGLTAQLLAFSRQQVIEPQIISVDDRLREMHNMLVRLIGEDIEFSAVCLAPGTFIKVDPGQFDQVIVNLAVNARDAMPGGGRLIVMSDLIEGKGNDDPSFCTDLPPGRHVRISVSDDGQGMPPEIRSRIFEPFFTTKELGKGTGLGLSTVYGIVKQAGGDIACHSVPGVGTTFHLCFPMAEAADVPVPETRRDALMGAGETVLIVDDEDMLRRLTARMLAKHGYTPITAESPEAALSKFRHDAPPVKLLITDVVMPGMSGPQLAERIRQSSPDLRTLFMSGHARETLDKYGVKANGRVSFVQKPFDMATLARKVRGALDKR